MRHSMRWPERSAVRGDCMNRRNDDLYITRIKRAPIPFPIQRPRLNSSGRKPVGGDGRQIREVGRRIHQRHPLDMPAGVDSERREVRGERHATDAAD